MSDTVLLSQDGPIATITMNRPKALNALDHETLVALAQRLDEVAALPEVRVLVLTGSGEKSFVAGADIKAMADLNPQQAEKFSGLGHQVLARFETLNVPVIAAVNGFALGGGLELALCADLIYASDNAKFGQPEVNLGLIPGFGGTVRLSRRIGAQAAAELILTGDTIDANRAYALGLVVAVCPQPQLLDEVRKVALKIASRGPVAVQSAKRLIRVAAELDATQALRVEQQAFALLFATADQKEGCRAFTEKRAAQFVGA